MGDADTAGKEQDGTVGMERFLAAIRTFDESPDIDDAGWRGACESMELGCHAFLLRHDEGDGGGGTGG